MFDTKLVQYIALSLLCIAAIRLCIKLMKFFKWLMIFKRLPSLPYSVFTGNAHFMLNTDGEGQIAVLANVMREVDPKMAVFWLSPISPIVMVHHPDTMHAVLLSSIAYKPRGPGQTYELVKPWIGDGLGTSNGPYWEQNRRLLNPTFHAKVLKSYLGIINQTADALINILDKYAASGESFDVFPLITMWNIEIIMKCLLGSNEDIIGCYPEHHPHAKAFFELGDTWVKRFWTPYLRYDWLFNLLPIGKRFKKNCDHVHKITDDALQRQKDTMRNEDFSSDQSHVIRMMLESRDEDGNHMTSKEIRDQLDTFLFAGHDTTSCSISFNLYNMAVHQEYQNRVQVEVDGVLRGRHTDDIQWDDLSSLKLMSLCIKENMRMFAPAPFTARELMEEFEIEGIKFPAGTIVQLGINNLHYNPLVWNEPHEYRPERFNDSIDKFQYIPFSAGPRNCIGQVFSGNVERILMSKYYTGTMLSLHQATKDQNSY